MIDLISKETLHKIIEELEDLNIYYDGDYFSGNNEPMLIKREVLELLKRHLSNKEESPKTD